MAWHWQATVQQESPQESLKILIYVLQLENRRELREVPAGASWFQLARQGKQAVPIDEQETIYRLKLPD
jgi:hypothetical protein